MYWRVPLELCQLFYLKDIIMPIDSWLPALLAYFIPLGLFLMAWGGISPERARRGVTVGALALGLAILGYFVTGFAFHLGGAYVVSEQPGLAALDHLFSAQSNDRDWGLIGLSGFFLAGDGATNAVRALFVTYVPLVAASVLLVTMSLHDTARGWQMVLTGLLVGALVFPVAACWVWGGGWLSRVGFTLDLGHGFVDHAGAGVVYWLSGMVALGALIGTGVRVPALASDEEIDMPPAHFPLLANLGVWLFALGWLGWLLSSPFHVSGSVLDPSLIAVNGLMGATGAVLTSQFYCWLALGRPDPLMAARGAAAGIVALSAGAPFMRPWSALVVGVLAGFLFPIAVYIVERVLRLRDQTATVALGVVGGALGLLSVALFADGRWGQGWNGVGLQEYLAVVGQGVTGYLPAPGYSPDGLGQLLAQVAGLAAIGLPGFLLGWGLLALLNLPYRPHKGPEPLLAEETGVAQEQATEQAAEAGRPTAEG